MKVYVTGEKQVAQKACTIFCAPAAEVKHKSEIPSEWLDDKGEPKQFQVVFEYGAAEVPDSVGRWMIKRGVAQKTRLILPQGLIAA